MRIAMDVREACKPRRTGKGQWVHGLLRELLRREVPLVAYTDQEMPTAFAAAPSLEVRSFPSRGLRWHLRVAQDLRKRKTADVYVSTTSFIVPWLLGGRFPVVPVVHDLIAFADATHERRATLIERLTLGRAVRRAARVCTVSEATKRDLCARFPSLDPARVTAIFAGGLRECPPENTPDGVTVLCTGTLSPRKNQRRLLEAFARLPLPLRSRSRLILTGARGWRDDDIVALAASTPGVTWKDYVSDDAYEDLLAHCAVFALPSLAEGFGLQLLDALQRGIPVLTSGRGSMREVCGNAAHYVDPEDVSSIASGLVLLLGSERIRFDLRQQALEQAKKFSWERTAGLLLDVLAGL